MSKRGERSELHVDIKGYHKKVTGSCIRNTVRYPDGRKFRYLVDFGFYQGKEYEQLSYNNSVNPEKINAILLTHSHLDHDGALPILFKEGYGGKVYTSKATSHLLETGYEDSLGILSEASRKKNIPKIYAREDVEKTLLNTIECEYEKTVSLDTGISVTFFNNGHLVGASMILVSIEYFGYEPINILYTGDYKETNIFSKLKSLPSWLYGLNNLTIVTEATYGSTNSWDIQNVWEENIIEACNKNSIIVIPTFAQGRFQEMLYYVKVLKEENKIPKNYPVLCDGKSGINYTFKYKEDQFLNIKDEMKCFFPEGLQFVDNKTRPIILNDTRGKIIITTSGMGGFGPAQTYIPAMLPKENAVIHFSGYTAEGTLGRRLQESEYGESVYIHGVYLPRRAKIYNTSEFSSHAKADELIYFLNKFNPRSILINHGEQEVKDIFARRVGKETSVTNIGILGNEYTYRIDPYGINKAVKK